MAASRLALRKLCGILFFYVQCFTSLAQEMTCVITYSLEELLEIRAAVTYKNYQHYDQEYNFTEAGPLFALPRAIELIPEAEPKHYR